MSRDVRRFHHTSTGTRCRERILDSLRRAGLHAQLFMGTHPDNEVIGSETDVKLTAAVAWLNADDWPRWLQIDPELPPYDHWRSITDNAMREASQRGVECALIAVDPDQFALWCKTKGYSPNETSRADYAAAALAKRPTRAL